MFKEYTVEQVVKESRTIKSFYLSPKDGMQVPSYLAGQFVNIKVKPDGSDKELVRSYTLSDKPGATYLRLTVKREEYGKVSAYLHEVITVGGTLLVSDPMGDFHLSVNNQNPLVLISGGVGITPMLSMAEYVFDRQPERQIYFIHSSLNRNVQPMLDRLQYLKTTSNNFKLVIFHSDPLEEELVDIDYDYRGFITQERLPLIGNAEYMVCGPVAFMETVFSFLSEFEIAEDKIHFEFFQSPKTVESKQPIKQGASNGIKVTLVKSQKTLFWQEGAGTLLELVESAGLQPDNSCRMGTCATCQTKLLGGSFQYEPEPFMEPEEGNILICCAIPTSNVEIDL
ncbi:MAG: FAD-binding oxidoreductase [Sediminibacterium sp.]|nr:FAD-binding oxidoreductase [Sediminibacterium sp.]